MEVEPDSEASVSEESINKEYTYTLQGATISVGAVSAAGSVTTFSSPQALWVSLNQQQLIMLLLVTRIYLPKKVIGLIDSLKFALMSFSFIRFDKLPMVKLFIEWITHPLKTPELKNYDIDYGCSFHDNLSLIVLFILLLLFGFFTT